MKNLISRILGYIFPDSNKNLRLMEALDLLLKSSNVEELAAQYADSAKRSVEEDIIRPCEKKVKDIKDELFYLKQIHVESDRNRGIDALTIHQCKERFKDIVNKEYSLSLAKLELEEKKKIYARYFSK